MPTFTLSGTVLLEREFTATVEAANIEEARQKIRANFDDNPTQYAWDEEGEVHSIVWD